MRFCWQPSDFVREANGIVDRSDVLRENGPVVLVCAWNQGIVAFGHS